MADAIMQRAKQAAAAYYRSIGNEIDAELVWAEHGHEYIAVQAAAFALRQPQLPSDDGLIKALRETIVELWHDANSGHGTLHECLGMTWEEYQLWVMDPEALSRHKAPLSVAGGDVRPEVLAFAALMERKLRANDHKPGWHGDGPGPLMDRLLEEAGELERAVIDLLRQVTWRKARGAGDRGNGWSRRKHGVGDIEVGAGYHEMEGEERQQQLAKIASEAADVANFAMMLADVCGQLQALTALQVTEGDKLREALEGLLASCTRTAPALHDDCGTRIVTAPTVDALRKAREALRSQYNKVSKP